MNSFKLNGPYSLTRDSDGAGDSGLCLIGISTKTGKSYHNLLKVGFCVQVGSITARSYSEQDYWQTTPITEFTEYSLTGKYLKFKTRNSSYTLTFRSAR